MKLADIVQALGVPSDDFQNLEISGLAIDSRKSFPGSLFVCLKGENADGHDFIADAIRGGAVAILSQRPLANSSVPVIVVEDTVSALGEIASLWRSRTSAKVVGITGTAGKTTLKESVGAILSRKGITAKNPLNFNNQIGLPRSMLDSSGKECFWVMEAGISRPGDMETLGAILEPDMAIILNVGPGHLAGLGKRGVAWHKSRFLSFVKPGGCALLSADYPSLMEETAKFQLKKFFFSTRAGVGDYYIEGTGKAPGSYRLCLAGQRLEVQTPFLSDFGAEICIAAAAAAHILGLGGDEIRAGFSGVTPPPHRFVPIRAGNWLLLDDTYNANPLSMRRVISAGARHAADLQKEFVLVLGEMGELGEESSELHRALGEYVAGHSPGAVFWVGKESVALQNGLAKAGYKGFFAEAATPESFLKGLDYAWRIRPALKEGGVMLFKGSRVNRLENFLDALLSSLGSRTEKSRVL